MFGMKTGCLYIFVVLGLKTGCIVIFVLLGLKTGTIMWFKNLENGKNKKYIQKKKEKLFLMKFLISDENSSEIICPQATSF